MEVVAHEHARRGDRQERERLRARAPPRGAGEAEGEGGVADDPGELGGAQRRRPEREQACEDQRPEQIGVALDPLARVVDEAVALHEMLRVAQRDEGVVADPGERRCASEAERAEHGESG